MTNDDKMSFTDRQIRNSDAVHFLDLALKAKEIS